MAVGAPDPARPFGSFGISTTTTSQAGIDWRRSASSDHLFVREREWEAAHTVWLWVDLSPSMHFRSSLSKTFKDSRAVVLALALSELLARAGERVGVLGNVPFTGRNATRRVAEVLVRNADQATSLPPPARLSRFSECLLFSDFLEPIEETSARLEAIAAQGVRGHLVQILDPAEETLPYEGRTEFTSSEGSDRVIAGRAETLRERYQERLKSHRTPLAAEVSAASAGPSSSTTPTGRPRSRCSPSTIALPGLSATIAIGRRLRLAAAVRAAP